MSSFTRVPYLSQLVEPLKRIPTSGPLTKENLSEARKFLGNLATLEGTLTDSAICHEERTIPGPGGNIALAILRSKNSAGGLRPAIYYIHGGAMAFGTRFYEIGTTLNISNNWTLLLSLSNIDFLITRIQLR